jgi:hypothetical protein
VALREAGQPPTARERRARPIDEYLDKIEELVVRPDVSGSRTRLSTLTCGFRLPVRTR